MSKFVNVDIELPENTWKLLEQLANDSDVTLNELINDIICAELDKIEDVDYEELDDETEEEY